MEDKSRIEDGLKRKKGFTAYEYKEIITEASRVSMLIDGYENFGWELDEKILYSDSSRQRRMEKKQVIRLKRNRKIMNKTELTRLQRNFEACLSQIQTLEKSITSSAAAWALTVGAAGTVFMAGSTFAVTAQPPQILLCTILAVPGIAGWIAPWFLYRRIVQKRTERTTPLIEEKYDEMYEVCEKGNKLLY